MNMNPRLPLVLGTLLLSGCSTSVEKLNKQHTPAVITPRVVFQRAWAVDEASFAAARAIEILPRLEYVDFFPVFQSNSRRLMESLLGTNLANIAPNQAEYVLRVQIGNVLAKMGMMAWQEGVSEIQLTFNLARRQGGGEVPVASVSVTGRAKGSTGNAFTFVKKAHNRANTAINDAFVGAQAGLADALAARSQ